MPAVIAVDRLVVPAVKAAMKAVDLESTQQYTTMETVQYYVNQIMNNTAVQIVMVLLMSITVAHVDAFMQFLNKYMVLIATSFAVYYAWKNHQWQKWACEMTRSVNQVEKTSQVVATRSNMMDFRMCSAPAKSYVS